MLDEFQMMQAIIKAGKFTASYDSDHCEYQLTLITDHTDYYVGNWRLSVAIAELYNELQKDK